MPSVESLRVGLYTFSRRLFLRIYANMPLCIRLEIPNVVIATPFFYFLFFLLFIFFSFYLLFFFTFYFFSVLHFLAVVCVRWIKLIHDVPRAPAVE